MYWMCITGNNAKIKTKQMENLKTMTLWELEKAMFLLKTARELNMDISTSELIVSVNNNSGYTYLWSENYNFTLYMPISCELTREDVYVLWTNSETGEEIEENFSEFFNLKDIENWANELELTSKN